MWSSSPKHSTTVPQQGFDLETLVELTLEEVASGCERVIEFTGSVACGRCGGSGCVACGRQGVVATPRRVTARFPAGIAAGQAVRLAGEGEPGRNGGPPGHLHCYVQDAPHGYFARWSPTDVACRLPVDRDEAGRGAVVDVPTPWSVERLTIHPATPNGLNVRLPGHGIPDIRTQFRGDLVVVLDVLGPHSTPSSARDIRQRLCEDFGGTVTRRAGTLNKTGGGTDSTRPRADPG